MTGDDALIRSYRYAVCGNSMVTNDSKERANEKKFNHELEEKKQKDELRIQAT